MLKSPAGNLDGFAAASHDAMARSRSDRRALTLAPNEIGIDNFEFTPKVLTVKAGTKVTWINKDDVPHLVVNTQNRFHASPVLDTDQRYSVTLIKSGSYDYFCSLHPKMEGKVVVE